MPGSDWSRLGVSSSFRARSIRRACELHARCAEVGAIAMRVSEVALTKFFAPATFNLGCFERCVKMNRCISAFVVGVSLVSLMLVGCGAADSSDPSGSQDATFEGTQSSVSEALSYCPNPPQSYPLNRIWVGTSVTLAGCACVTTKGVAGKLQSQCSPKPTTCGFLYCLPN